MKLDDNTRAALNTYPLYSQDGKRGEAVAVARLFITGTAATYYILEGNTKTGELYGVSNMERHADGSETWTYGYYYLPELEELNLYGGLVHVAADADFTPTKLADIPEIAEALAELWKNED